MNRNIKIHRRCLIIFTESEIIELKPQAEGEVDKLLGISLSTSNGILKKMVKKRMIAQYGTGKKTKYISK